MIPLSDAGERRYRFPFVNLAFIGLNLLMFIYELSLSERLLEVFFLAYGVVPRELVTGQDLSPRIPFPLVVTLFTSMFMHAGWLHLGSNMLYLYIFGDNVEDRLGHLRYILFYFTCGVLAALAQVLVDPSSRIPSVGASGAIAGVLGAYLVLFPNARVTTLLLMGIFTRVMPLPALLLIGFWAVTQLFSGVASLAVMTQQTGGVAYWAHIGGFGAGLALVFLLRPRSAPRRDRRE